MPSTGTADTDAGAWRLGRRPALDGVRAIAVALVLVGHAGVPYMVNAGAVGVNLFFTLSGFLITTLLIEEMVARDGRLAFGRFYLRRALRLLPALVALIAGVWVLDWWLDLGWVTPGESVAALFYATNFWVYHGPSGVLGHTWSLSLEEQFYLTWPLLLFVLFRIGRHRLVLVTAVVLGFISMMQLFRTNDIPFRTLAPDSRSFFLLFGCALAAAITGAAKVRPPVRMAGVAAAVLLLLSSMASGNFVGALAIQGTVAGTLVVVWLAATRGAWLLEVPLLRWVGQRSYAIYLWHFPVLLLAHRHLLSWSVTLAVTTGVSVVMAILSWRFVEAPFLRLKDRTAPRVDARQPTAPERSA